MSQNNNNTNVFAGGIILIVVVIGFLLKAIEKLMIQVSQTADAVGMAAQSFLMMALKIALVLGLIAIGLACIYAAIYFSYRYYKMVRRATDLQAEIDRRLTDFSNQMNSILKDFRSETRFDLNQMSQKLSEALDKPTIAPEMLPEPAVVALPAPSDTSAANDDQTSPQDTMSPQNVTNPF